MSDRDEGAPVTSREPTNRELAAEIKTLSEQLGVETPTQGMAKAQLFETLERLRGQLAEREAADGSHDAGLAAAPMATVEALGGGAVRAAGSPAGQDTDDTTDEGPKGDPELEQALTALADDGELRRVLTELLARGADLFDVGHPPFAEVAREAARVFIRGVAGVIAPDHPALARALLARIEERPAAELRVSTYKVARGRSLITRRGIVGPGEAVHVDDVVGGLERLEELRRRGRLVRG